MHFLDRKTNDFRIFLIQHFKKGASRLRRYDNIRSCRFYFANLLCIKNIIRFFIIFNNYL